jgi:hypothetical protein
MSMLLVAIALAASVNEKPVQYEVWRVSGSDQTFDAVKTAAAQCQYPGVEEVFAEHLVPYLHIVIPERTSAQYECLRDWLKVHPELGVGVPPTPKAKSVKP